LVIEYPLPAGVTSPTAITAGPDGNLWFIAGAAIGRISTQGSAKVVASVPGAVDITSAADGNVWVTVCAAGSPGRIGRVNIASGAVRTFDTTQPGSCPQQIARGPDGALWYTDTAVNTIGRIAVTDPFTLTLIPLFPPSVAAPQDITPGPDGNLWFTGRGQLGNQDANYIGRMKTTGDFTTFPLPDGSWLPESITAGPDGNLWFVEAKNDAIGRISTSGVDITEFPLPQAGSRARKIALGPDIKLWFTEENAGQVGQITTTGTITEYSPPTPNSKPAGIVRGPDGNLWFAESNTNKIAKMLVTQTRNLFLPIVRR
jgi:streptogramin lyase